MTAKLKTNKVFRLIDEALASGKQIVSLQGSTRSGKTYNAMIWLIYYALSNPATSISIVRATLPSIKKTVFRDFEDIMIALGLYNAKDFNKSDMVYKLSNGSYFEFFSVDNEQKVRGAKRQILFVNEANELKELQYTQLMLRTTLFTILDYNPSFSEEHWLSASVNREERTAFHITTYKDNPFLEESVIKNIESLKTKNANLWRIYGLGLQGIVEGLVFPNIELIDEMPNYIDRRYRGIDFGYSHDPTAIVEVGIEGSSLYIHEIEYKTEMLSGDIIRVLKQSDSKVISESADPRLVSEIKRAGINIHPVKKFQGSIEAGIQKMQECKIYITKDSINLIKEFKNYTYAKDKEGKFINKPIDAFNHGIDAIRYVVLMEVLGGERKKLDPRRLEGYAFG